MAWKRYSDEDALKNLLEIEIHLLGDMDVLSTCHTKPTPTFFTKKRKAYPAPPPLWEAGLVFGRGSTPTFFSRHKL